MSKDKLGYSKFVFMDNKQREEWENLSDVERSYISHHLLETTEQLSAKHSITLLCNIIFDLEKRILDLENAVFRDEDDSL